MCKTISLKQWLIFFSFYNGIPCLALWHCPCRGMPVVISSYLSLAYVLSRWFLVTVVSALIGVVMMLLLSLTLFVMFFAARDTVRFLCDQPLNISLCDPNLRMFGGLIPDPVFPTVTIILAILSFIATLLVGHLTCFHLYLSELVSVLVLRYLGKISSAPL